MKNSINDYYLPFPVIIILPRILSHYPLPDNYEVSALEGILEVVSLSPACLTLKSACFISTADSHVTIK